MTFLDWFLVVLVLAYAVSGYWQGFIAGAFATIGLVVGGLLGIWLAPQLLGNAAPSVWVSLGALFVVLVCASFGQAVLQYVGTRVRDRVTWQPVRALDAVGGAALSVAAVLLVTWMLGVAVSGDSRRYAIAAAEAGEVPAAPPRPAGRRQAGRANAPRGGAAPTAPGPRGARGAARAPGPARPRGRGRGVRPRPPGWRTPPRPSIARTSASLSSEAGMNACPPKPGLTLITSTRSARSRA